MKDDPLASRLSQALQWPVALVGAMAAAGAVANALGGLSDRIASIAVTAVAAAATGLFLCAVTDRRFQEAVAALNIERRADATRLGWLAQTTGVGLPMGDQVLATINLAQLAVILAEANSSYRTHGFAVALGIAGFFLVGLTRVALMARGYPKP